MQKIKIQTDPVCIFFFVGMSVMKSYALVFVCVLLSSCSLSMSEKEKREHFIFPPSLENSAMQSVQTPFFTMGDWPATNWWESFQSPDLNAIMEEALRNSPPLQEAGARLERARQISLIAKAPLYPWVSFDGDNSQVFLSKNGLYRAFNPKLPLSGNLTDLFIGLQYDCDIWGKNRQLYRAAVGEFFANQAEAAQTELVLTTAIAIAFFSLKIDLIQRELFLEFYDIQAKILQLTSSLKASALVSNLSVLTEEEALFLSEQRIDWIEEQIALDKHLLNTLMGRGPDELLEIGCELAALPHTLTIPCNLSLDRIARRPDLMAQIWRTEALSREVGAAIADFYPNVSFNLQGGVESFHFSNLLAAQSLTYSLTPAIHLPIFTAGSIQANVGRKKEEFNEAVFAYNQLLLTSAKEVADALSAGKSIYQRRIAQEMVLKSAKNRKEIIAVKKRSGLSNLLDFYVVQLEVIEAEMANLKMIDDQYAAVIQLIKALGGGYDNS